MKKKLKKGIVMVLTAALVLTSAVMPVQVKAAAHYSLKWTPDKQLDAWIDESGPDGEFIQVFYHANEAKDGITSYDVWIWTENGGHICQRYSVSGQLLTYDVYTVEDSGENRTIKYDGAGMQIGEVIEVTDSEGNWTCKEYNKNGVLIKDETKKSDGSSTYKEYDKKGNLVWDISENKDGKHIEVHYDNGELLSAFYYTDITNDDGTRVETYYRDKDFKEKHYKFFYNKEDVLLTFIEYGYYDG